MYVLYGGEGCYVVLREYQNRSTWGISSIGRVRALQARGTGIETRILHLFCHTVAVFALVAQMVERKTLNLVVVGSIPTGGAFCPTEPSGHGRPGTR